MEDMSDANGYPRRDCHTVEPMSSPLMTPGEFARITGKVYSICEQNEVGEPSEVIQGMKFPNGNISIRTSDINIAYDLCCETTLSTERKLTVYVNGRPFNGRPVSSNQDNMNILSASAWVQQNSGLASILSKKGTFSIHSSDRDRGYEGLALFPFLGLTEHLFHPDPNIIVGKPANFVTKQLQEYAVFQNKGAPDAIGAAKQAAIESLIESSGVTAHADYTHEWQGDVWEMRYTATRLPSGEVLLFCENLKSRQRDYWRDLSLRSR